MNTEFLTGPAGTGKTETVRQRVANDPGYGVLASTTGISAINLGTRTLNSLLTYFNTRSLEKKARNGQLRKRLLDLDVAGALGRNIIIDEVSMMCAAQLDIIYDALLDTFKGRVGLVVTGDFAQLPPVSDGDRGAEFAFEAACWPHFENATTRLTLIHRQHDPVFLDALAKTRQGNGLAARALEAAGVEFAPRTNPDFDGVTLVPTNAEADEINASKLAMRPGQLSIFPIKQRGRADPDWSQIPPAVILKPGVRVMTIANDPDGDFANGDLGLFEGLDSGTPIVRLDRTGTSVPIGPITRKNIDYEKGAPVWLGEITFTPLKIAHAMTIHKCQGLTIPNVQLHIKHWFAGEPALIYVAVSRVREAAHLRIVGSVEDLEKRIKAHPKAGRYL